MAANILVTLLEAVEQGQLWDFFLQLLVVLERDIVQAGEDALVGAGTGLLDAVHPLLGLDEVLGEHIALVRSEKRLIGELLDSKDLLFHGDSGPAFGAPTCEDAEMLRLQKAEHMQARGGVWKTFFLRNHHVEARDGGS